MPADRKGSPELRAPDCRVNETPSVCPHIRSRETWDKETFSCDRCGERYTLYDDEMK